MRSLCSFGSVKMCTDQEAGLSDRYGPIEASPPSAKPS
jgi:hypothetical protein